MMEWIIEYWIQALFGVVIIGFGAAHRLIVKKIKLSRIEQDAICEGVRALLRDRIIDAYQNYCNEKQECPMYALESIMAMYKAYHALGGNGAIDKIVEELQSLPVY